MYAQQKGFTLIELLVVIAITAIMATIALPNMSEWIASRRAASQAEQVANLLRFARAEAVRLNLPVYVCPVQFKKNGVHDGKCNADFKQKGLLAYADKDNDIEYKDKVDISLRATLLNPKDIDNHKGVDKVAYQFDHVKFSGKNSDSQPVFFAFQPNGTFGYSVNKPTKKTDFTYSDGYIKISMTDSAANTESTKKSRASIVLVDSSGRVEICAKSDSRDLCKYAESKAESNKQPQQ